MALCDRNASKVSERQREYFPAAAAYTNPKALLADGRVQVVDLTPHPVDRLPLIEAALLAGKHVLSQKPFVTDIAQGERLADLADERGLKLAVNQNGRWAPHLSYARHALRAGHLGRLATIDLSLHFDHNWTAGTRFDRIHHLVLYDFAIHWFDFMQSLVRRPAESVTARVQRSVSQHARPPLLAHALVDYGTVQATLTINGDTRWGQSDRTVLSGSDGTLISSGPDLNTQAVTLHRAASREQPVLEGTWFSEGFQGAMGELLCAIEEDRQPEHAARENLASLELCFAAIASADGGGSCRPGQVRTLPASVFASD